MTTQNGMSQKPFEAAAGPWANLSHTYCKQMDTAFKSTEPAMQAVGRMQAELAHLTLARARAWAALPADLSRCKSPADLAMLQFNFWQAAGRTYAQGWQRMLHAATALAQQGLPAANIETRRDVITVPEMGHEPRNRQAA